MKTRTRTIEQIVEDQVKKWSLFNSEKVQDQDLVHQKTITISREPGSGGRLVAEKLAEKLNFDYFDKEILQKMSESSQVSNTLLETLDGKGLSVLDEWIASLVDSRHLWPDQYLQHLMKIIAAVGKHGRAVIVGRGANFILPIEKQIRIRIVAPMNLRIERVAKTHQISAEKARRRVIRTESDRKAFIRKYFNADINDPINYDFIINTSSVGIDFTVDVISMAVKG